MPKADAQQLMAHDAVGYGFHVHVEVGDLGHG
jgi:hypothetical protein